MKSFRNLLVLSGILASVLFLGNFSSARAQSGGAMTWEGTVDDHIQIVISGRNARVKTLSGTRYRDARFNFEGGNGNWGDRNRASASVDKQDGRGKAYVIQQPSRRNGNTTIIQVDDTKGGADRYRLRITWN